MLNLLNSLAQLLNDIEPYFKMLIVAFIAIFISNIIEVWRENKDAKNKIKKYEEQGYKKNSSGYWESETVKISSNVTYTKCINNKGEIGVIISIYEENGYHQEFLPTDFLDK